LILLSKEYVLGRRSLCLRIKKSGQLMRFSREAYVLQPDFCGEEEGLKTDSFP
jgi:hypothetical protein